MLLVVFCYHAGSRGEAEAFRYEEAEDLFPSPKFNRALRGWLGKLASVSGSREEPAYFVLR